jgi:hypothetical protein
VLVPPGLDYPLLCAEREQHVVAYCHGCQQLPEITIASRLHRLWYLPWCLLHGHSGCAHLMLQWVDPCLQLAHGGDGCTHVQHQLSSADAVSAKDMLHCSLRYVHHRQTGSSAAYH